MRKKKLLVNVGETNVMSCFSYVNEGRMNVRLYDEPLQEADSFKYLE